MNVLQKTLCLLLMILALSFVNKNVIACSCSGNFKSIKSFSDLNGYELVALVKITSENINPPSDSTPFRDATLGFEIIEKFKGKEIREIIEQDLDSSCDMGINVGDEWVLFGIIINGKLLIRACDRNVRYRDRDGVRDWHFKRGIEEVEDLRRLNGLSQKSQHDGISREYYPDDKIEIEETFQDGLRNGIRTVYHRNGEVWGKQMFVNDSLQGKSEWFFPSGQLYDQKFYRKDLLINNRIIYYDTTVTESYKKFLIRDFYKTEDSLRKTFNRIQVQHEHLHDYNGKTIRSRQYSRWGIIQSEYIYHPFENYATFVYYHRNGQVSSIGHHKDFENIGHYQEYDAEGNPTKSWDYDTNGKQINIIIPK